MNNGTVLVTGGAGFIGSHLIDRLLIDGCKVVGLDNYELGRPENLAHLAENSNFQFLELDILDRKKLRHLFATRPFDAVFHLAANSDIARGGTDMERDLRLTFLTTFEVLEAMRETGTSQIIFASSSAVYGDRDDELRENSGPLQPVSLYGAGKLAAEAYISAYAHNFGIQGRICRFPNVVGERATHGVVFDFINRLRFDPTCLRILGDGRQEKPYLYVRDLVEAILFIWKKTTLPLDCFNIGVPGTTAVTKIAEIVAMELGLVDVIFNYTGGDRGWVGDVPRFRYDAGKLNSLGWNAPRDSDASVRLAVQRILNPTL
jgi:UDP-glucose 4-epimerase